ncbi:hypothetical protein EDC40_10965 [Aminobacter aminovorans]|uniref:Uncharacterized protein n=1 Tax=Aminobacter aminovorans TaxID=83263 RepID=A0A380WM94_AMIAI|nr:hypothetical protein [Aminobacter aminovorans]TCS24198.1 hypothetical protein EDC40_10965 [Aminobacter aminovorans]SUU89294.1 Uncharacterised protein [Aminobacter aminovorans]
MNGRSTGATTAAQHASRVGAFHRGGQADHIAFMAEARQFYRQPFVEVALVCLLLWQVGSGLVMLVRGWARRNGAVAWLQAGSGGYLAFFLVNHVAAVIAGRTVFGLDTDFRFAAAGFFAPPWHWFFAPYYFLGVLALFVHVGCAAYWGFPASRPALGAALLGGVAGVGALFAALIVMALSGSLFPVTIPSPYLATYGQ